MAGNDQANGSESKESIIDMMFMVSATPPVSWSKSPTPSCGPHIAPATDLYGQSVASAGCGPLTRGSAPYWPLAFVEGHDTRSYDRCSQLPARVCSDEHIDLIGVIAEAANTIGTVSTGGLLR